MTDPRLNKVGKYIINGRRVVIAWEGRDFIENNVTIRVETGKNNFKFYKSSEQGRPKWKFLAKVSYE